MAGGASVTKKKDMLMTGRTGKSMSVQTTIAYIYSNDAYRTVLVASYIIEVHSRSILFSKSIVGAKSQNSLHLPEEYTKVAK